MKTLKYLNDIIEESKNLKRELNTITRIANVLHNSRKLNQTVFIIGNGGSASTATHMACDLFKTSGVRAVSFENIPLNSAITNDEGWSDLFKYQLQKWYKQGDILIAISVHGGKGQDKAGPWSQNLNKAVDFVNSNKGITIGLSGFDGGYLKEKCTHSLTIKTKSTPVVESMHVVLHHLFAFMLQEGDRK